MYKYEYVWVDKRNGKTMTDVRYHHSQSEQLTSISAEIMNKKQLLIPKVKQDWVVRILERITIQSM